MGNKKKGIIPPVQLALFSGIAGHLINSIIEKVDFNNEVDQRRNATIDPNGTVVQKKRGKSDADIVDVVHVTEDFVTENCPYIVSADNENNRYYITQSLNIGRYPHNDYQISDNTVSRVHCRIFIRNGRYYLVDMGASSPARLNGTPVENSKPSSIEELYDFELTDGDRILVGRTELIFRRPEAADTGYRETIKNCNSTVVLD